MPNLKRVQVHYQVIQISFIAQEYFSCHFDFGPDSSNKTCNVDVRRMIVVVDGPESLQLVRLPSFSHLIHFTYICESGRKMGQRILCYKLMPR